MSVCGPVHELDAGPYRAVLREGVPMIERDATYACVRAVMIPIAAELLAELKADWSDPVQVMVDESGELIFRTVSTESRAQREATSPDREKD